MPYRNLPARTVTTPETSDAARVTAAIAAVVAAQDVTVPAEAATGRVIAELAGEHWRTD
jgi:hypothetical protein